MGMCMKNPAAAVLAAKLPQFCATLGGMDNTPRILVPLLRGCAALALAGLAWTGAALAEDPAAKVLSEAYKGPGQNLPVARFDAARSGRAFIIDQSHQGMMLFRYVRSREVFVLRRVPGPRGDLMLKNDLGAVMVRISRVGGPVLFPGRGSQGIPAWPVGAGEPLGPQSVNLENLRQGLSQIADDLAGVLQHNVTISANGASAASAWVYLYTALNVRAAIARLVHKPDRKGRRLPPIQTIRLSNAKAQDRSLHAGIVHITLAAAQGFAGRPSSLRLAGFLSGKSQKLAKK